MPDVLSACPKILTGRREREGTVALTVPREGVFSPLPHSLSSKHIRFHMGQGVSDGTAHTSAISQVLPCSIPTTKQASCFLLHLSTSSLCLWAVYTWIRESPKQVGITIPILKKSQCSYLISRQRKKPTEFLVIPHRKPYPGMPHRVNYFGLHMT